MIISRNEGESDEDFAKRIAATQKSAGFPSPPEGWASLFADKDKDDEDDGDS